MKQSFIAVLVLILSGLSACAPAKSEQETLATRGITVTDALGRAVTFENLPQRIVIAGRATIMVVDVLYLFPEAPERVAAVAITTQGADFFPMVDPNAQAKVTLETQSGPEQITAAQPDLVILKSYLADSLGQPLEVLQIPVFYVSLETPEQYVAELEELGKIMGNEQRAEELVAFYQDRLANVEQAVAGIDDAQKPTVLVLQHSAKGGETAYQVPPANWMQTLMVQMAGGRPAWVEGQLEQGWMVVTLEQIAAWNPEQIYIIDYFDDPTAAVQSLRADPVAQNLNAVQADQVFAFPKDTYSWDQPDTRWILGLTWLAAHIHPDRFVALDLQQEYLEFYRDLYNLDETFVQSQLTPLLQGSLP